MPTRRGDVELLGRRALLDVVDQQLVDGRSILLVGPAGIGKSALIRALATPGVMVVDPFEGISAQRAACIRRSLDRGAVWIGAARTLDRARMGKVGRIAWRFTTVRVSPLSDAWMRRLITHACSVAGIRIDLVTPEWRRALLRLARGRPGPALAIIEHAARMRHSGRPLPFPATAYLEAALAAAGGPTSHKPEHDR